MMSCTLHCGSILLIALLSGLTSGTNNLSMSCCEFDSIQLFKNTSFDSDATINLYRNGKEKWLIGTWDSIQNPSFVPEYKETVFRDEYGAIWIRHIQRFQQGKYVLSYNSNIKSEVDIDVMVAPTNNCKPKIKKLDNLLIASLEDAECGKPPAYVHWQDHPGTSKISKEVLKLLNENEAGIYSACAETPALKCVKTFKFSYYCTVFTVKGQTRSQETGVQIGNYKGNSSHVSSEISDVKILFYVMVGIVSVIVIGLAIFVLIYLLLKKSRRTNRRPSNARNDEVEMEPFLNGDSTNVTARIDSENTGRPPNTRLCTICHTNNTHMFVMTCCHNGANYLPTCTGCSETVQQCPKCKAK